MRNEKRDIQEALGWLDGTQKAHYIIMLPLYKYACHFAQFGGVVSQWLRSLLCNTN
jgi:hypothetical protein